MALFGIPGFASYSVETNTFEILHLGTWFVIPGLEFGDYSAELGLCDLSDLFVYEDYLDSFHEDSDELYQCDTSFTC